MQGKMIESRRKLSSWLLCHTAFYEPRHLPWPFPFRDTDVKMFDVYYQLPVMMLLYWCLLTHWGRDKIAAVSQTTLSNAFSWMKMLEFRLRFHWNLFLRMQSTIIQQDGLVFWRIYASFGFNELIRIVLFGWACETRFNKATLCRL